MRRTIPGRVLDADATMVWIAACRTDELVEGRGLGVTLTAEGGMQTAIALFRSAGELYALEDRCPHRGARLSTGPVYEPCKVACLDHGWSIDLRSGLVEAPECGRVRTYAVRCEEDRVYVCLDAAPCYHAAGSLRASE